MDNTKANSTRSYSGNYSKSKESLSESNQNSYSEFSKNNSNRVVSGKNNLSYQAISHTKDSSVVSSDSNTNLDFPESIEVHATTNDLTSPAKDNSGPPKAPTNLLTPPKIPLYYPRSDSNRKSSRDKVCNSDRRVSVSSLANKKNYSTRHFNKKHSCSTISSEAKQKDKVDATEGRRSTSRKNSSKKSDKDSATSLESDKKIEISEKGLEDEETKINVFEPELTEQKLEHENHIRTEQPKLPSIVICDKNSEKQLKVSQDFSRSDVSIDEEEILKNSSFKRVDCKSTGHIEFSTKQGTLRDDTISNQSKNDFGADNDLLQESKIIDEKIQEREKELNLLDQKILTKMEEANKLEETFNQKVSRYDEEYNNKVETTTSELTNLKQHTNFIDVEIKKSNHQLSEKQEELKLQEHSVLVQNQQVDSTGSYLNTKNIEAVQKTVELDKLNEDCKELSSKINGLTQSVEKMKSLKIKEKMQLIINKLELNLLFPTINALIKNKVLCQKDEAIDRKYAEMETIQKLTDENISNKAKIENLHRSIDNNKKAHDFMKKDFGAKIVNLLDEKKKLKKSKEELYSSKLSMQQQPIEENELTVPKGLKKSESTSSMLSNSNKVEDWIKVRIFSMWVRVANERIKIHQNKKAKQAIETLKKLAAEKSKNKIVEQNSLIINASMFAHIMGRLFKKANQTNYRYSFELTQSYSMRKNGVPPNLLLQSAFSTDGLQQDLPEANSTGYQMNTPPYEKFYEDRQNDSGIQEKHESQDYEIRQEAINFIVDASKTDIEKSQKIPDLSVSDKESVVIDSICYDKESETKSKLKSYSSQVNLSVKSQKSFKSGNNHKSTQNLLPNVTLLKKDSSKLFVSHHGDNISEVQGSNIDYIQEKNDSESNVDCKSKSYKSRSNFEKSIFTKTCTAADRNIELTNKENLAKEEICIINNSDSTSMDSIANDDPQDTDNIKKEEFYANLESELNQRVKQDQQMDSELIDEETKVNNALKEEEEKYNAREETPGFLGGIFNRITGLFSCKREVPEKLTFIKEDSEKSESERSDSERSDSARSDTERSNSERSETEKSISVNQSSEYETESRAQSEFDSVAPTESQKSTYM